MAKTGRPRLTKEQFLSAATLFEGGLLLLAVLLGWLVGLSPLASLQWESEALSVALLGVIPLLVVFTVLYRLPFRQLQDIRDLLFEVLGPYLTQCRWYELLYVASLAGVGEELFFRGFLQPWLEGLWNRPFALIMTSLLFGLAHSITPLYTLMAAAVGLYLSWSLDWGPERNLLVPMVIHTAYDFFAFLFLSYAYKASVSRPAA